MIRYIVNALIICLLSLVLGTSFALEIPKSDSCTIKSTEIIDAQIFRKFNKDYIQR